MPVELSRGAFRVIQYDNETIVKKDIVVQIKEYKIIGITPVIIITDGETELKCVVNEKVKEKLQFESLSGSLENRFVRLTSYMGRKNFQGNSLMVYDLVFLDRLSNASSTNEPFIQLVEPTTFKTPVKRQNDGSAKNTIAIVPYASPSLTPTSTASGSTTSRCLAISSLNPTISPKNCFIVCRVTYRSHLVFYKSKWGNGRYFVATVVDQTGEIVVKAFNEFCDLFYEQLQLYKIYYISGGRVKLSTSSYTRTLSNQFELILGDNKVRIDECTDTNLGDTLSTHKWDFIALNLIPRQPQNCVFDVIGIVKDVKDLRTFVKRGNDENEVTTKMRCLTLIDSTNTSIILKLWGQRAENFYCPPEELNVIAVKRVKVDKYDGTFSLSGTDFTEIYIHPNMDATHHLCWWYNQLERCDDENTTAIDTSSFLSSQTTDYGDSERDLILSVAVLHQASSYNDQESKLFTVKGIVKNRQRAKDCFYKGCLSCNSKLLEIGDELKCQKCNRKVDDFQWRLKIAICLADEEDDEISVWITLFNDTAEQLLTLIKCVSKTANDLVELRENQIILYNQELDKMIAQRLKLKLVSRFEQMADGSKRPNCTCKRLDLLT